MSTWTADQIKHLRKSMGLTQNQFAEKVGVTRVYINYLEKGVRTPNRVLSNLFDCIEKANEKGE